VLEQFPLSTKLDTTLKKEFLMLPALDVLIHGEKSPMMVAATRTSASLARCFLGEDKKVAFPVIDF